MSYVADLGLIDGKRERHSFTKGDADTFAEQKRTQRLNEGLAGLALPQEVRNDVAEAAVILSPHGVSLLEPANYYATHVLAYKTAPELGAMVEKLIADAEEQAARQNSWRIEITPHQLCGRFL